MDLRLTPRRKLSRITRRLLSSVAETFPSNVFGSGVEGLMLDPSDLTTLFQDTAGTQPVTTAGQTVALALDKSKGLVLGPELVTNGDFSGGSTGWTVPAGWSIAGGVASSTASTASLLGGGVTPVAGRTYRVDFDVVSYTSGDLLVTVGGNFSGNPRLTSAQLAPGRKSVLVIAGSSPSRGVEFYGGTITASIDNISVRELSGIHATQSILASRPLYQVDASGRGYLSFDGIDDFLVTPTITPNTDKAQVFAGVRKLSDAAAGLIAGMGIPTSESGAFELFGPVSAAPNYNFRSSGTSADTSALASGFAAPITNVLSGLGDIGGDRTTIRVNNVQIAQGTADQGTGNYLSRILYIGRRAGTSLPFNGHIYGLVVRFGPNLDAATIAATEAWMNTKTGAY